MSCVRHRGPSTVVHHDPRARSSRSRGSTGSCVFYRWWRSVGSQAVPAGFTVTAASASDYRPRLDRQVARSKVRFDREVRRKEAHERADEASTFVDGTHTHKQTHMHTHTYTWRPIKSLPRWKEEFTVDIDGGGRIGT